MPFDLILVYDENDCQLLFFKLSDISIDINIHQFALSLDTPLFSSKDLK